MPARDVVSVIEIATEVRRDTEHAEEVRTYAGTTDAFGRGPISAREIVGVAPVKGKIRETPLGGAPIEVIWVADRTEREVGAAFAQSNQPFWMRIGQRSQKNSVDDAKDCGVRTDAERESEDSESGEAGRSCGYPNE